MLKETKMADWQSEDGKVRTFHGVNGWWQVWMDTDVQDLEGSACVSAESSEQDALYTAVVVLRERSRLLADRLWRLRKEA